MDDTVLVESTPYYKLTDVLKELGIKRFEYNDTTGQDDDFITHNGVDYISPYMVKLLIEKMEKENVTNGTPPAQYINSWATGG